MSPDRSRLPRAAAIVAAAVAGVAVLWVLLANLLHSDRGIDLTDEGLYLLAAEPPSDTAAWVVPFGWHTKWLFSLVGHDIADFRTAAAVIVVLLGAIGGHFVVRRARSNGSTDLVVDGAACVAGGVSALLLFAGLLRSPGYNWVNLVGLLIATAAALGPSWTSPTRGVPRDPGFHIGTAGIAAGAVTAVVAKPTSGPGIVALALLYVLLVGGLRAAAWATVAVGGWIAVLVAGAVIVGLWPTDFLTVFRDAADFPPLHENLDVANAARDAFRLPLSVWDALLDQTVATRLLLLVGLVSAVLVAIRPDRLRALRWMPLACCTVAAIGVAMPLPGLGVATPKGRFAWPGTSTWAWILVIGALLHALCGRSTAPWRQRWLPSLLLVGAATLFGFGSGHGAFRQTGLGAVLVVLAALALVAVGGVARDRRIAVAFVAASAVLGTAATMVSSVQVPYRIAAVDDLDHTVRIGTHGATLAVDAESATMFDDLTAAATAGGWCPGDRLLGFVWRWSSTIPYHLGATVPEPLMPTIFGYPFSVDVAGYNLDRIDDTWADAWVLISDPASLRPRQASTVGDALDLLRTRFGRTFPDDYVLAASSSTFQLWRPHDVEPGACTDTSDAP